MAVASLPSPALLRQLLRYESETGWLYWKERPREMFVSLRGYRVWNSRYVGKRAFTYVGNHGYYVGAIFDKTLLLHRVVWALGTGAWPIDQLDHIDGDRLNNRLVNLREATDAINRTNTKIRSDNTSGAVGVYPADFCPERPWTAQITKNKHKYTLGYYATFEEAVAARKEAERLHGFHANHGRAA